MVLLYYLLALVLVAADQLVKLWIRAHLELGQTIPFLPGLMGLTYVQNTGAAFSSFSGLTWLLALVSLAAAIGMAIMLWRGVFPGKWGRFALALLLGGAVGNLIDRIFLGFVTDMFEVTLFHFAVFNVADICVVLGGILLAVYVFLFWDRDRGIQDDAG